MKHDSLRQFLANPGNALAKGPIAMIFAEDEREIDGTLRHHLGAGFRQILVFTPDAFDFDASLEAREDVHRIRLDTTAGGAVPDTVNRVIEAAPGLWMYYCFNAEYLFYPFCESRTVGEMLTFHTEEKRDAMITFVVDLYAGDLDHHPDAVAPDDAHIDRSGYYALGRHDPATGQQLPQQLDFLRRPALAVRGTRAPRTPPHRPDRPVPGLQGGCGCAAITPSTTPSTTPIPAPGTTT